MSTVTDSRLRIRLVTVAGAPRDAIVVNGPQHTTMDQTQVLRGIYEGWLVGEGHRVVTRPAGPWNDPWLLSPSAPGPHTFHHFDALVIGRNPPVRYRVVRNPDKYVRGGADTETVTPDDYAAGNTEVTWFYELIKET